MLYHNSINFIKNCEDKPIKKLDIYKRILDSLCIHDTIQTNIFEVQDWDELYDIASIYGSSIPNYYFNELNNNKTINIEFTTLLNKISQMYVNKKLLNSAKISTGKLNIDNDELIYYTEIISYYFNEYKSNINNNEDVDIIEDTIEDTFEDTIEDNIENNDEDENTIIPDNNIFLKKNILQNNSELIKFMNKYSINIDGLENILKIEKLNLINEKRKKKFTLKIKKEISNFLTTFC